MLEYEVKLILRTSYENRIKNLKKEIKKYVIKNTYNKKLKVHSLLFSINANMYYKYLDLKSE